MHKQFQKDLIKLRLKTAKQYIQMLSDGLAPMSYAQGSQIRLNAAVTDIKFNIYSVRALVPLSELSSKSRTAPKTLY